MCYIVEPWPMDTSQVLGKIQCSICIRRFQWDVKNYFEEKI